MFRDYIRRLSQRFFWISKWIVATAILVALLVAGVLFLLTRNIAFDTFLNYFALGLLIFVIVTLFYLIIAIHDVPYEIAKRRNHPHQDAIHAAGWVSLFTLHALWPFLWIWAMLYRPDRGWGIQTSANDEASVQSNKLNELIRRVETLEKNSRRGVAPRKEEQIKSHAKDPITPVESEQAAASPKRGAR